MADSPDTSKKPRSSKPPATEKTRSRAKKPAAGDAAIDAAGDDADLRTRIARRAYEISQGPDAGDDAENWLQAEREIRAR